MKILSQIFGLSIFVCLIKSNKKAIHTIVAIQILDSIHTRKAFYSINVN